MATAATDHQTSNGHGGGENGHGNGHAAAVAWRFAGAKEGVLARTGATRSIRAVRYKISASVEEGGPRPVLPLAHGDPSVFPAFRTAAEAEDAVAAALRTGQFNCYPAGVGLPAARHAVAEHLSEELPYKLSADDVFLTAGGTQAIEVIIPVLAQVGTNILLPRPGYPNYEARSGFNNLEVRHFDLLPEKGWEIDLTSVEAAADENTTAIVIINPNNPCGSVYSYEHLAKVAEVARKLGILVIADEVYGKLVFGSAPFVPMGVFGHIAPVLTIGSLSKRWIVPGWRLGWVAICDPTNILKETQIATSITNFLNVSTDPATFIQAALPEIIGNTKQEFFTRIVDLLIKSSEICYREIKEIDCITCPHKPEGSMFVMVKLNLSLMEEIHDDIDFCCQLAKEESVILCPGSVLGMENWVRITFAIDASSLQDGLQRIKNFCQRHKKNNLIKVDPLVHLPSFNDGVKTAQDLFRLGRDENSNLRITHGRAQYLNPRIYERYHHVYFETLDYYIEYEDGGPVIDLEGKVVGIVNSYRRGSFIPSSILLKCLDLWKKFKFIPRPHIGLMFSAIKHLDPVHVDKIWREYKIDDGLIVEEVSEGSDAERVGIRRGDIIRCFNGECISTTIELENMLLSLCKGPFDKESDVAAKVQVLLEVFHTRKPRWRSRELTVGVSAYGEVIQRGRNFVDYKEGTCSSD